MSNLKFLILENLRNKEAEEIDYESREEALLDGIKIVLESIIKYEK